MTTAACDHFTGATASFRQFTATEDEAIRAGYKTGDIAALAESLGRTVHSIRDRARRLGVYARKTWTRDEEKALRALWGEATLRSLSIRFGRSCEAVYFRARKLGIVREEIAVTETVTEAAKRTGFCRAKLVQILRAHGVTTAVTRFTVKYKSRPYYRLDPFDVDAAVEAHLERETLGAAARRLGVAKLTLSKALRRIGVTRPATTPRRHRWLIDGDAIDRAMAERRAA